MCEPSCGAFLKTIGLSLAILLRTVVFIEAGASAAPRPAIDHFVPVDKQLARGWLQSLYERGKPEAYRGLELDAIGMPVGGIGAGQLYLCGDGTLGCWEVFNRHEFLGTGDVSYIRRLPARPVEQGFAVAVGIRAGEKPMVRPLTKQGFADVTFRGQYPIGTVCYSEDAFPVRVTMDAFSPFIPLNAKDSALPATLFHITIENISDQAVYVGMMGWLENAVCRYSAAEVKGVRRSRIIRENGRTLIIHSAEEAPKSGQDAAPRSAVLLHDFEGPDYGSWQTVGDAFGSGPAQGTQPGQQPVAGFLGKGLVNSYPGADAPHGTLTSPPFIVSRRFINFLIGGGGHAGETCINLLVDGQVMRSATGHNNERLDWHSWNVQDLDGKQAQIQIVDRHSGGWGHINVDHIELSDERRKGFTGPVDALPDAGTLVLALDDDAVPASEAQEALRLLPALRHSPHIEGESTCTFPEAATSLLATPGVELAAGGKHTLTWVLAWHFPNAEHGHEYAARFADASQVAHYALDNVERLTHDTRLWRDTYYDSTLPHWLLHRLHIPLSFLATGTCQWWKNGRFYAYEGVVCCGGNCTHVWNYAQAHARLFPELARSAREMQDFHPVEDGGGFHADSGLVGFRSNDAYAADGQCGTILKAYREHLMSPDNTFLERNWPRVKQALEFAIRQDGNEDGLIENSQHNTYDINFEGPNTFVGSLYLAALRAAEEMAMDIGERAFARRVRSIFDRGRRLTLQRLWNGEYFIQEVDLAKYPQHQYADGCLSDQLFGQSWAHHIGLGYIYPETNVKQALRAVWNYNWAPDVGAQNTVHKPLRWFATPGEAGLLVCTWPKGKHLDQGVIYKDEVWTGIEYQVAGHMIWEGMLDEGLALCRAIHDRYHPIKRNPYNEVECGDHYARALASWGVFTALAGYEYHGPKGYLGFAPKFRPEDFRAAFTAAEGWGTFRQQRQGNAQREEVTVYWGRLRLKRLTFRLMEGVRAECIAVTVGGHPIKPQREVHDGRLTLRFPTEVTLRAGETLEVLLNQAAG